MNAKSVEVPNYVLLDRAERIAPELLPSESGQNCVAIYGFSDKQPYDAFCENSELALTPYPLVKGYLQNRLEAAGDTILIVAIDAASPDQTTLDAATMQSVLVAMSQQSPLVEVTHRLTRDDPSNAYRVEECGSVVPLRLFK
ncbi:hypothetical protein K239x_09630 [Planctomycetes bacterium K23_9]|uniref:Uncharacterized protein n=2 Tax=Stieleria marina TaxID=1930275 RepID=A0A517NPI5_9BACT|nr:hypothetical protein K239x_09630 [Planctomycetes bacterium K23_9]